jgi:inosose dehydratase
MRDGMKRRDALRSIVGTGAFLAAAARRATAAGQTFQVGYAAITWGGDDRLAIADIAKTGFHGIQLRSSAVEAWGARPAALKSLLGRSRLSFVALSSGMIGIDPATEAEETARHLKNARFVKDAGGEFLQVIDAKPARPLQDADYAALGRRLTDLGRKTAELGVPLGYHHHMGSLGESPEAIDRILAATDPNFVRLQLDTAHYLQGGGDPVAAVRRFGASMLFVHLKDVTPATPAQPGGEAYRFVELGRGRVDVRGVVKALRDIAYPGWVVVELDEVPDPSGSPRQSAERNRRFLVDELGVSL